MSMLSRHQMQEKIPEIIIEVSSIVLAVLLALAVNEWREARKTQNLVDHATETIINEMWRNRKVVEFNLPSHREIVEALRESAQDDSPGSDQLAENQFFNPIFLRSSAWQAAMTTGAIGAMPYDTVSSFSEIYSYQDAFLSTQQTLMEASIRQAFTSDPQPAQLQGVAETLGILVLMEDQLMKIYEGYLDGDRTYKSLIQIMQQSAEE